MTRKVINLLWLTAFVLSFEVGSASAQGMCGPGDPFNQICTGQAEIAESLADLRSDVSDLDARVSSTATDLGELESRVALVQAGVDAIATTAGRLESSVAGLAGAVDRVSANLDAHTAAAHQFWTSPTWLVLEGTTTTQVTALNLGTEEVEVVFTFFDRDGRVNGEFSTNRLLPSGASITILLDDRGIDPPQHGWFAVTASGPVQVDGYTDFERGDPALAREYSQRTLIFYPVDCRPDPATWASTQAPYLCSFIDRELTRLW